VKRYENRAEDVVIAYVGGGSRGWAWGLMSDLAGQDTLNGTVRLYDIDKEAAVHNEVIGNAVKQIEGAKGDWRYQAVDTLKEALSGADFIVLSILPGTFDEMESDVHAPEQYGIYQSVGDTAGPGGLMRALRTIPMYVEIAEAIRDYAPNAWVINYTNPMTLCMQTLYEVFPKIKAFGCCHEVFGTQELLSRALEEMRGIKDVKRQDISVNVLGINHFTWIDEAWYRDINLLEVYREFVEKYYESGYLMDESKHWMNNSFASANRVKFDLFRRYGAVAAAGDRHLAEFMPGAQYLKDPETVKEWMFGLTTVQWRKEDLQKRRQKSADLVSGERKFELSKTGEEGVHQMMALAGYGTLVTNVNLPNIGQIANLPIGAVVETNAVFRHNTVRPVAAGSLSNEIQAMVARHAANHRTILTAALNKDANLAFQAFLNDPLMTAGFDDAKTLFSTMLENTKEYLPGWSMEGMK
jgi:alpha-galactosidase/6-phospho-beta-glucosidase family protein